MANHRGWECDVESGLRHCLGASETSGASARRKLCLKRVWLCVSVTVVEVFVEKRRSLLSSL
jgi:hypothetical protein